MFSGAYAESNVEKKRLQIHFSSLCIFNLKYSTFISFPTYFYKQPYWHFNLKKYKTNKSNSSCKRL